MKIQYFSETDTLAILTGVTASTLGASNFVV